MSDALVLGDGQHLCGWGISELLLVWGGNVPDGGPGREHVEPLEGFACV